ncbi:MAG: hypothetical protein KF805_13395 [Phycisphaeraceae bacterium]|nr:hypothetical protein [Phycisphaeraceae bacterium]
MIQLSRIAIVMCALTLLSSSVSVRADDKTTPPCPEICSDFYNWMAEVAWDSYQARLASCGSDAWCRVDAWAQYVEDIQSAQRFYNDCCSSVN